MSLVNDAQVEHDGAADQYRRVEAGTGKGEVGDGWLAGARATPSFLPCPASWLTAAEPPRAKHAKHAAHVNNTPLHLRLTDFVPIVFKSNCIMDPPNMDPLNLSDSDSDALFDTPAARKNKKKTQQGGADAGEGAVGGKARAKESHYTTEEAREVALRRELESIKNVNKVIEGVVESLQKAKDNMEVRMTI